jgi:NADH-quinone oxidoreductase subunit A
VHLTDAALSLSPWEPGVLSLLVYAALVMVVVGVLLFLSGWLGETRPGGEKGRPYECGIVPTGPAGLPHPVPFFLVAVFFVIFDVEVAFVFAWAAAFRELGWAGWLQVTFFIAVLLASLFYVWCKGGLEWGPTKPQGRNSRRANP